MTDDETKMRMLLAEAGYPHAWVGYRWDGERQRLAAGNDPALAIWSDHPLWVPLEVVGRAFDLLRGRA